MITKSEAETFRAAKNFSKTLGGNETIYLYGDVGVGKTVFSKGLAEGLGITETITSPTFTYFNTYESGRVPFIHFDLYRVKRKEDIVELGISEYLSADGVKAVEWAEILGENPSAVKITIKKSGNKREIIFENSGK